MIRASAAVPNSHHAMPSATPSKYSATSKEPTCHAGADGAAGSPIVFGGKSGAERETTSDRGDIGPTAGTATGMATGATAGPVED